MARVRSRPEIILVLHLTSAGLDGGLSPVLGSLGSMARRRDNKGVWVCVGLADAGPKEECVYPHDAPRPPRAGSAHRVLLGPRPIELDSIKARMLWLK